MLTGIKYDGLPNSNTATSVSFSCLSVDGKPQNRMNGKTFQNIRIQQQKTHSVNV